MPRARQLFGIVAAADPELGDVEARRARAALAPACHTPRPTRQGPSPSTSAHRIVGGTHVHHPRPRSRDQPVRARRPLSRPAELRALPSGDEVLALEVTVRPEGRPAESVPVAWTGAPAAAERWAAGEEILVVGRVRRRFFRAGGATQSRTEVAATVAVPTRRGRGGRQGPARRRWR